MDDFQGRLHTFAIAVAQMRKAQVAVSFLKSKAASFEKKKQEDHVDQLLKNLNDEWLTIEAPPVPPLIPDAIKLPPVPLPEPMQVDVMLPVPPLLVEEFGIPEVPPLEVPPPAAVVEDEQPAKRGRKRGGQHGS